MQRPLRLLAYSHSARIGGSEQLLLQLIHGLVSDRGVECTSVVPAEGQLAEALRSAGREVWIWPTAWWCGPEPADPAKAQKTLAAGAAEVLRGLADARCFDPDAVLSMTTVIPWGGLTAALLGKPHLWYVTDFGGAADHPPHYLLPFEEVRRALQSGADRSLAVSRAVRDRLFFDAPEPPPVIYPHLPSPPSAPDAGKPPEGGPTVLTAFGVVRPPKGQWDAVEAVAELSRRGLETELVLVGYAAEGGEEILELARKRGVEDRVRVVDAVPDQYPWMARSDIVVVPSHEETFSLVCLEALLHAKPLVATRVGGIVEFVHDGANGLTVPPGDPQALASAVERLIREPDLARRLAEEGRRRALERFTAEGFSGEVRRLLDEVASAGRRCATPAPLLAPLEALAREHQELREASERAQAELARACERQAAADRKVAELAEELRAEREQHRAAEEKARAAEEKTHELAEAHARISSTRAWRLVQAYWRLANRLRP